MKTIFYNGKERKLSPLLMKPELVAQTLKGIKTETRRLSGLDDINLDPENWRVDVRVFETLGERPNKQMIAFKHLPSEKVIWVKLPYGVKGDLIWIRETWSRTKNINDQDEWPGRPHMLLSNGDVVIYTADGHWQWLDDDGFTTERTFWKPNLHMPFAACRLFLEITEVGLERLQDITQEGAMAEGVTQRPHRPASEGCKPYKDGSFIKDCFVCAFRHLWNVINGEKGYPWNKNPWVWCIKYKVIEKPI